MTYRVKLYRRDSTSVVVYERVKHAWWSGAGVFVVSVLRRRGHPEHDYWEWPRELIDHVKIEKVP